MVSLPREHPLDKPREAALAMGLSLVVGVLMLAGKSAAFLLTGSAAILSDAIESVIHVAAVAFAAFALWLSLKPANPRYPFGYERISFFSAGFEGALIVLAAVTIIYSAVRKWITGFELEHLGTGTLIVFAASLVNALLGWYLIRTGRRTNSLILEANGKHVLTDSWTSFGVIVGLLLVLATGWKHFDPICAIAVAANILWSGGDLMRRSVSGLLDYSDPKVEQDLQTKLDALCAELGIRYHALRFRSTGYRLIVHIHLLFPFDTPLGRAHQLATELERRLPGCLHTPAEIVTHLESEEDHEVVHPGEG